MGAFHALGYVCAMGAAEGLREAGVGYAAVGWPTDIVDARTYRSLLTLRMHAGYDKGMFGECRVLGGQQAGLLREMSDGELAGAIEAGIVARVASWEAAIAAGGGVAGPLAPVLSEYFDLVPLLGQPVEVVYPNGKEMARGRFAGVDIWGKATVVTEDGREMEFAPEVARILPA